MVIDVDVMPRMHSRIVSSIVAAALTLGVAPARAQSRAAGLAQGDLAQTSRQLEQLAARVGPAVVEIITLGYASEDITDDEKGLLVAPSRGSGSGVILDSDGYIVTNAHVVESAHRIQVQIATQPADDDKHHSVLRAHARLLTGRLIAIDEETDLAVIKVEAKGLPTLDFADSDQVQPGQLVLAFGSPMGLNSTVTLGVISAIARQLEPDDAMIYLQTDAPINPGNSGGPLVNVDGKVVGINTLILSQSGGNEGLGFAAPSNIVRNVFEQIRKYGRVRRGEIGVRAQTITPLLAEGLHLPRETGVILSDVYPETPAERSGLKPGDIVVSLDGKPMENGRQMQVNLYSRAVGDTVQLEIERGTTIQPVLVKVAEREDDPTRFSPLVAPDEPYIDRLGVLGLTLDAKAAEMLPDLRITSGVVIAATSAAALSGAEGQLKSGDVIHDVNGKPVTTVEELRAVIAKLKAGDAVVMQVEREGELIYVALRLEK
jgi:serine protease Do